MQKFNVHLKAHRSQFTFTHNTKNDNLKCQKLVLKIDDQKSKTVDCGQ